MSNHQGEATNEINVNLALRRGQAEVKFSFSSTTYFFCSFHQNLIRIPNLHFCYCCSVSDSVQLHGP